MLLLTFENPAQQQYRCRRRVSPLMRKRAPPDCAIHMDYGAVGHMEGDATTMFRPQGRFLFYAHHAAAMPLGPRN